jgi:hypothetical protein
MRQVERAATGAPSPLFEGDRFVEALEQCGVPQFVQVRVTDDDIDLRGVHTASLFAASRCSGWVPMPFECAGLYQPDWLGHCASCVGACWPTVFGEGSGRVWHGSAFLSAIASGRGGSSCCGAWGGNCSAAAMVSLAVAAWAPCNWRRLVGKRSCWRERQIYAACTQTGYPWLAGCIALCHHQETRASHPLDAPPRRHCPRCHRQLHAADRHVRRRPSPLRREFLRLWRGGASSHPCMLCPWGCRCT